MILPMRNGVKTFVSEIRINVDGPVVIPDED